jgi:hypothetical protein
MTCPGRRIVDCPDELHQMTRVANTHRRALVRGIAAFGSIIAATGCAHAATRSPSATGGGATRVTMLSRYGVTAVLVDQATSSRGDAQRVDALAKRLNLHPFMYSSALPIASKPCGPQRPSVVWHCAQLAASVPAALRIATRGGTAIVKASVATLLRSQYGVRRGHLIFVIPPKEAAASAQRIRAFIAKRNLDVALSLTPVAARALALPLVETANLWVDPNGGGCSRSATPAVYDDGAACSSFNAAYGAAQLGDVVLVKAGTYSYGVINDDPRKDSPIATARVTIRAAMGEHVQFGNATEHGGTCSPNSSNTDVCASNLELADMRLNGLQWHQGVNLTLTHITVPNGVYVSGQNFRMIGGQVGPANSNGGSGDGVVLACAASTSDMICDGSTPAKMRPTATFDGVTFTHILKTVDLAAHTDCLQTTSFASLTIENSTFTACADAPIILGDENEAVTQTANLLIQNNFINEGTSQGLTMGSRYRGSLVVQYNTFNTGALNVQSPVLFRGNAITSLASAVCTALTNAGATLTYNVFGNGSMQCGSTNFVSRRPFGFVSAGPDAPDLHIHSGSPLVARGDPAHHPAKDIDGQARSISGKPDAGADQAR